MKLPRTLPWKTKVQLRAMFAKIHRKQWSAGDPIDKETIALYSIAATKAKL